MAGFQCVQKISIYNLAKLCPVPPQPNEGIVKVLNSGMQYGMVCPGENTWTNLTDMGCHMARVKKLPASNIAGGTRTEYDFVISTSTSPGDFKAYLLFSQPVTTTSVTISGVVRHYLMHNFT